MLAGGAAGLCQVSRVADPHSFHPDPDPEFQAEYRSGSNTDPFPDPIRIKGFNDQKN
jgi:hypothetical protein